MSAARCPCCGARLAGTGLVVDLNTNSVVYHGAVVPVTTQLAEFLYLLAEAAPALVSYDRLINGLYGGGDPPLDPRNVLAVLASKSRRKLAPLGITIEAIRARGFRLFGAHEAGGE